LILKTLKGSGGIIPSRGPDASFNAVQKIPSTRGIVNGPKKHKPFAARSMFQFYNMHFDITGIPKKFARSPGIGYNSAIGCPLDFGARKRAKK
jgi:hypothetical protein